MAVNVTSSIGNYLYNEALTTQTTATANGYDMEMDDFWQLLAAQLQYQDPSNPMSNTEMMNQIVQMSNMSTMSAMSDSIEALSATLYDLATLTLTNYSTNLIGKEVTVAKTDASGAIVDEIKGVVTGVDLTGSQYIYVDGSRYQVSQVMAVGDVSGDSE